MRVVCTVMLKYSCKPAGGVGSCMAEPALGAGAAVVVAGAIRWAPRKAAAGSRVKPGTRMPKSGGGSAAEPGAAGASDVAGVGTGGSAGPNRGAPASARSITGG